MLIHAQSIHLSDDNDALRASEVGWFAAKQPGLLRFIEDRHGDGDALACAVDLSWRIVAAFEHQSGLPLARLDAAVLEEHLESVVRESRGELELVATGCAYRQPELCQWLASALREVLVLAAAEHATLAATCLAVISACDECYSQRVAAKLGALEEGTLLT